MEKNSKKPEKPIAKGTRLAPDARRKKLTGKRYVFTSVQNNTYIHEGFFKALQTYCADNNAELVISRFTYNKSGFQNSTKDKDDIWFDERVLPFVKDVPLEITKNLIWGGELDILPTAENPLSGFDNYFRHASGIVPHAKVAMKSLAGMKEDGARMLYTTGALTMRNYIQRKAGQKAEFHHVYGALVVEVDEDGDFFARQLCADSKGNFQDLDTKYNADGSIQRNQRIEALNPGDIHIEKMDEKVHAATFGENGILDTLKPRKVFIHDLFDFAARNHHNIKDPHFLAMQHFTDGSTVEEGIAKAAAFLRSVERPFSETVVVESNHDKAYTRWLREADVRNDPVNAEFFHRSNAKIYNELAKKNTNFHAFEWACREKESLKRTKFLQEDDSYVICKKSGGIECGQHGHIGPNGSRGNPNNLKSIGRKINTGHTHSAGIIAGVYTAGVSAKLDMGYNKGPSSWSHSHIVTYPSGKRAIVTIKNGKWRA